MSSDKPLLDISKLTDKDIESLRSVLGINSSEQYADDNDDEWQYQRPSVLERAYRDNVRVEVAAEDISDSEALAPCHWKIFLTKM